jgi:hypothetical protein
VSVQTQLQPLVYPRYLSSSRAGTGGAGRGDSGNTGNSNVDGNGSQNQNRNRSQPQSPQQDSHHHPRPRRRFDLSTADLKADLQARRLESASHEVSHSNTSRRQATGGRTRDDETEDEGSRSERTDLGALDVFAGVAAPSTAIDACLEDGFHLNNGMKIAGGDGCLLVDGEVFTWRPWEAGSSGALINKKGQWEISEEAWGVLRLVWPKPGEFYFILQLL